MYEFLEKKPSVEEKTVYNKYRIHTNKYYDLNIIEWRDSLTKIHTHPENGCIVKSLHGMLHETRYDSDLNEIENNFIVPIHDYSGSLTHSYFLDKNVIHSIKNASKSKSYSLHLYSPPDYEPKIYN